MKLIWDNAVTRGSSNPSATSYRVPSSGEIVQWTNVFSFKSVPHGLWGSFCFEHESPRNENLL